MLTSEWPTVEHPQRVPFLVREVEHLRQCGVDVDVYPFRGEMKFSNYFRAWMRLQEQLKQKHYDLIHAQFGQSGVLALWPKSLPYVVTYRGSDLNGIVGNNGRMTWTGMVLQRISQLVALRANEIILVSEQMARFLPIQRYHVIPSGVDLQLFHPQSQIRSRETLNLDVNGYYVLFAGNQNNPIKRYSLARAAIAQLQQPVQLLIAQGVLPSQMPLYMNAADVLLLTSAHEGSPNVVKEALACDLPVVSVDVGDVHKRLNGIEGCFICEDDRPETLAAALRKVLLMKQRIQGRIAVQDLDMSRTVQRVIDVYKQALTHRNGMYNE